MILGLRTQKGSNGQPIFWVKSVGTISQSKDNWVTSYLVSYMNNTGFGFDYLTDPHFPVAFGEYQSVLLKLVLESTNIDS